MNDIRAVIFDWGRTLFDSETKTEYQHAEDVLKYCATKGYALAVVSLVSPQANATLEERISHVENSSLRKYFVCSSVTDADKDASFEEVVHKLNIPREQILIVDDRAIRGIRYGSRHGHPTVWFQNGKFAHEEPNEDTGIPTYVIHALKELKGII